MSRIESLVLTVILLFVDTVRTILTKVNHLNMNDLGVELRNIDVANLSDDDFEILHEALLRHKVVVVRNHAHLGVADLRRFAQRFGVLTSHIESSAHHPDFEDVNFVSNIVSDTTGLIAGIHGNHTETFHSDLSWSVLATHKVDNFEISD